MKQKTIVISMCLWLLNSIAQTNMCNPVGIKTDTRNGVASNPQRPELKNKFNWMDKTQWNNILRADGLSNYSATSPFEITDQSSSFYSIAGGTQSDYYPEEGWELLKMNFGYLNDGTKRTQNLLAPYAMLYNKYQSKIRVLATVYDNTTSFNIVSVILSHSAKNATNQLNASALMSVNDTKAWPLDIETKITSASMPVNATNSPYFFFYADFPVTFDPCVCYYKSEVQVEFKYSTISSITLSGTLAGNITTSSSSTQPSSQLKILNLLGSAATLGFDVAKANGGIVNPVAILGDLSGLASAVSLLVKDPYTKEDLNTFAEISKLGSDVFGATKGFDKATVQQKLDLGKAALAKTNSYISGKIKAASTGTSSGTVVTGALQLTGTSSTNTQITGTGFKFGTPGSLGSIGNPEETNQDVRDDQNWVKPEYATYNEPLGVFALLETPEVNIKENNLYFDWYTVTTGSYINPKRSFIRANYGFGLNKPVKYVFNPNLDINWSKSSVKMAFKIERKLNGAITPASNKSVNRDIGKNWITYSFIPKITPYTYDSYFADPSYRFSQYTHSDANVDYLSTSFFSPNKFFYAVKDEYTEVFERTGTNYTIEHNLFISFYLDLEMFSLDKNGNPNKVYQVYSYPVKAIPVTNIVNAFNDKVSAIDGTTYWYNIGLGTAPHNVTLDNKSQTALGNIFVYGGAFVNNTSSPIVFKAGEDFITEQQNINESISFTGEYVFEHLNTYYVDGFFRDNIESFCKQGFYKSKLFAAREDNMEEVKFVEQPLSNVNTELTAFPNPTTGEVSFALDMPSAGAVDLYITDLLGIQVASIATNESLTKGSHSFSYNTATLAGGVYFYTAEVNGIKHTKRLVVVK